MPAKKVVEGKAVEIAGRVVDTLLVVGELWTVAFVTCCVKVFMEVEGVAVHFVILELNMLLLVE